jgi:hypothetical protein
MRYFFSGSCLIRLILLLDGLYIVLLLRLNLLNFDFWRLAVFFTTILSSQILILVLLVILLGLLFLVGWCDNTLG